MPELPTGTVTFLFTDIEANSRLWERHGPAMAAALARHDALLRATIAAHQGAIVKQTGDGVHAVFARAADAAAAAIAAQRALQQEAWGEVVVRVRMALHTGAAEERDGDYYGPAVNRAARLMAVAHGGQLLLSHATAELVAEQLPPGVTLHELGEHWLKDLTRPEHIVQLVMPDLAADFPPLATLTRHTHNLPVQRDPLIGREQELAAVAALLRRPDIGLVTLTGPGGMGKTRLAKEVAAELLEQFADGIWLVELAPTHDPALVASAIAAALGVKESGAQPLIDSLKHYLRDKQMLLVLDNFEQVLVAAPLVAELLGAAPALKVLVTSRAPLHLRGEREVAVPPLALPLLTHLPDLSALAEVTAVRLFVERAQDVRADFVLTPANAAAVAEICVRLDGLPLAIELAAARSKILAPHALLVRLQSRLKLLTGGAHDLPTRQQTLRGTIDWSFSLLDANEQRLFTRLGVFVGGWTVEAAEAVCNGDGDLGLDVLDGLQSLLDKSLLRQVEAADSEPRFRRLETIREYALERLVAGGEEAQLRQAHAQYFLGLVETAERHRSTPDRPVWLQHLLLDHDNLRAALTWTRDSADGPTLLRLAGALQWFWDANDYFGEGRGWMEAAVRLDDTEHKVSLPSEAHRRARAKVLYGAGNLANSLGDRASADQRYAESIHLFRAVRDNEGLARVLQGLAQRATGRGDFATAQAMLLESATLLRQLGLRSDLPWTLNLLAHVVLELGDFAAARTLAKENRALSEAMGNRHGVALALGALAAVNVRENDLGTARQLYEDALTTMRELDSKVWIAIYLFQLGSIAATQGDYGRATAGYEASLRVWHSIGNQGGVAEAWRGLGDVAMQQGDYDQAYRDFAEALEICTRSGDQHGRGWSLRALAHQAMQAGSHEQARALVQEALAQFCEVGDRVGIVTCEEDVARLWAAQGQAELATRLLAAAEAERERKGGQRILADRVMYDATLASVRASLDEAKFKEAWTEGQAMTLEQAIAYALEETADD